MSDGVWMLALAWSTILLFLTPVLLRALGLMRPNFRQEIIPTAYGLYPMLWLIPAYWLWSRESQPPRTAYAHILAAVGYGILGLVDDKWGSREFLGIKGHVLALAQHQRITTGLIKAVGGISLGFAVAYAAGFRDILVFVICGLIIALTANAFNLLDLRPGRACAVFLTAAVLTIVCAPVRSTGLALSLIPA